MTFAAGARLHEHTGQMGSVLYRDRDMTYIAFIVYALTWLRGRERRADTMCTQCAAEAGEGTNLCWNEASGGAEECWTQGRMPKAGVLVVSAVGTRLRALWKILWPRDVEYMRLWHMHLDGVRRRPVVRNEARGAGRR